MEFLGGVPGIARAIRSLAREVSHVNQDFGLVPHVAPTLSCACPSSTASVLQLQVPQQLVRQLHPAPCCVVFNGPTCTHVDVLVLGRSERVSRRQREQPPTPLHPDFAGARCFLHRLTQPVLAPRAVDHHRCSCGKVSAQIHCRVQQMRLESWASNGASRIPCSAAVATSSPLTSHPSSWSNALSVPKLAADQASWPTSRQGCVGCHPPNSCSPWELNLGKHANLLLHLKPTLPLMEL